MTLGVGEYSVMAFGALYSVGAVALAFVLALRNRRHP